MSGDADGYYWHFGSVWSSCWLIFAGRLTYSKSLFKYIFYQTQSQIVRLFIDEVEGLRKDKKKWQKSQY